MNPPTIHQIEMDDKDTLRAQMLAERLGYIQTAYTSTSSLWGLFCIAENPEHANGPIHKGCIIKTKEFGLMFVQDLEDLHALDI